MTTKKKTEKQEEEKVDIISEENEIDVGKALEAIDEKMEIFWEGQQITLQALQNIQTLFTLIAVDRGLVKIVNDGKGIEVLQKQKSNIITLNDKG